MTWLDVSDAQSNSEVLPAGKYPALIDEAEVVGTKSGRAIKAKFRVFEGPGAGRIIFHYFNHENNSEMAQKIGRGQIKDVCTAMGIPTKLSSPTDLMGHKLTIKTKVEKTEDYGDQARITSFSKYEAGTAASDGIPF